MGEVVDEKGSHVRRSPADVEAGTEMGDGGRISIESAELRAY